MAGWRPGDPLRRPLKFPTDIAEDLRKAMPSIDGLDPAVHQFLNKAVEAIDALAVYVAILHEVAYGPTPPASRKSKGPKA